MRDRIKFKISASRDRAEFEAEAEAASLIPFMVMVGFIIACLVGLLLW
jgi:hypothetical protein